MNVHTKRRRIAVITRMVTINAGNQALSEELMSFCRKHYPRHEIIPLERHPSYLTKYSMEPLRRAGSGAYALFERWADDLVREHRRRRGAGPILVPVAATPAISLTQPNQLSQLTLPLRNLLRVRSRLASLGAFKASFERRLQVLENAGLVILNPAGEINPASIDVPMRQFLELRVAQKMGARVAVINHSFEVEDPTFRSLVTELYGVFDAIIVRDAFSRQTLVRMGLPEDKIALAPDMAFLATPAPADVVDRIVTREGIGPGTVAIAINAARSRANDLAAWGRLVQALQQRGKQVFFVSNELWTDRRFGEQLRRRYGARVMSRQYDYREYLGLLSKVDLVIGNRLHTSILAMLGGTPVVPVEPTIFKMKGVFSLIRYPIEVVDMSRPNWVDEALRWADQLGANRNEVRENLRKEMERLRQQVEEGLRLNLPAPVTQRGSVCDRPSA